ncbi:hypothetical protein GDO81_019244 [Engystomops pustulosus]|uniref:Uncharacterized protein n=1 Tax=Engystomops pustulosus TaxID=76066 RepID=A0AAV6ZG44_ENGPU|nr:hypothetical protein GDO81_019244 [Engystomops pustulosus]
MENQKLSGIVFWWDIRKFTKIPGHLDMCFLFPICGDFSSEVTRCFLEFIVLYGRNDFCAMIHSNKPSAVRAEPPASFSNLPSYLQNL